MLPGCDETWKSTDKLVQLERALRVIYHIWDLDVLPMVTSDSPCLSVSLENHPPKECHTDQAKVARGERVAGEEGVMCKQKLHR